MTRLVTERVTRAEAEQRRGRAGRLAPGWCFRLWTRGEEGGLAAFPPPEIASADLAGLALELAVWGAATPDRLGFLTPPPAPAFAEARALLAELGALDGAGRVTDHGRALAALPVHPRLGHMLLTAAGEGAGALAADLAALLEARDPLRGRGADLGLGLDALRRRRPGARGDRRRGEAAAAARAGSGGAGLSPGARCRSPTPTASPAPAGHGAALPARERKGRGAPRRRSPRRRALPGRRRSRRRPAGGGDPPRPCGNGGGPARVTWPALRRETVAIGHAATGPFLPASG